MFFSVLSIVIALVVGSPGTVDDASTGDLPFPGVPHERWFPSQIALAVVVESGGSAGETATGGSVAAPIAQKIFAEFFQ